MPVQPEPRTLYRDGAAGRERSIIIYAYGHGHFIIDSIYAPALIDSIDKTNIVAAPPRIKLSPACVLSSVYIVSLGSSAAGRPFVGNSLHHFSDYFPNLILKEFILIEKSFFGTCVIYIFINS